MIKIKERINWDYLRIAKEIPLLINVSLYSLFKKKKKIKSDRILIINSCLIGDFIASIPAIYSFIKENKRFKIDLVVSKPLIELAKTIKGVNQVYSSPSIYNRNIENGSNLPQGNYNRIILMRVPLNINDILKNIKFNKIHSYFKPYLKYGIDLIKTLKDKEGVWQFEDVNYNFINCPKTKFDYKQIFNIKKSNTIQKIKSNKKIIVIHTGSGWRIKLWSNQKWFNLISKLGSRYLYIFIGGTDEENNTYKYLKKRLPSFSIYSFIYKLDIVDLLPLMERADYFIGVDSGCRHIAHLVKTPSVILMGCGQKNFSPKNVNAVFIDKSNCWCTNLFCLKRDVCVNKIKTNEVVKIIERIL